MVESFHSQYCVGILTVVFLKLKTSRFHMYCLRFLAVCGGQYTFNQIKKGTHLPCRFFSLSVNYGDDILCLLHKAMG